MKSQKGEYKVWGTNTFEILIMYKKLPFLDTFEGFYPPSDGSLFDYLIRKGSLAVRPSG